MIRKCSAWKRRSKVGELPDRQTRLAGRRDLQGIDTAGLADRGDGLEPGKLLDVADDFGPVALDEQANCLIGAVCLAAMERHGAGLVGDRFPLHVDQMPLLDGEPDHDQDGSACNSGALKPVLYSFKGRAMSDERVLNEISVIGRITDLREVERKEPLPSERFVEAIPIGLTFDDVLLRPAKSELHPNFVDTSTRLTRDRKSTRLNSSHITISYAVF